MTLVVTVKNYVGLQPIMSGKSSTGGSVIVPSWIDSSLLPDCGIARETGKSIAAFEGMMNLEHVRVVTGCADEETCRLKICHFDLDGELQVFAFEASPLDAWHTIFAYTTAGTHVIFDEAAKFSISVLNGDVTFITADAILIDNNFSEVRFDCGDLDGLTKDLMKSIKDQIFSRYSV